MADVHNYYGMTAEFSAQDDVSDSGLRLYGVVDEIFDQLTIGDVTASADELLTYHREFQALFQRREQHYWALLYLCGQLLNLERKTMEAMVLALIRMRFAGCNSLSAKGHGTPRLSSNISTAG